MPPGFGCGVVFKLSPGGTETVLHAFTGGSDGASPSGSLIADSSGNLYGTTSGGGRGGSGCGFAGCGTVFKLSPGGTETVLYAFKGGNDGADPGAGLVADSVGNLYSTTANGGGSGCSGGCGTVFKLAGTGFVPSVPFLVFNAALEIVFGGAPNHDAFALQSGFALSSTAPGIDPVKEPVTLQIGTFAGTIPPGSFKKTPQGQFVFAGLINGVELEALIAPTGTLRYAFAAKAVRANLTGTKNPVPVTLTIGQDTGTTSVTADIR